MAGRSQEDLDWDDVLIDSTLSFVGEHFVWTEMNPIHEELGDSINSLFLTALDAHLYNENPEYLSDEVIWEIITTYSFGDFEDSPDARRNHTRVSQGFAILAMKYPGSSNVFIDHAMLALEPDYFDPNPDLLSMGTVSLHLLDMLMSYKRGSRGFDYSTKRLRKWMDENPELFFESWRDEVESIIAMWDAVDD